MAWFFFSFSACFFQLPLASQSTVPSQLAVSWLAGQDHETWRVTRLVWSSLQSAEWVKKSLREVQHVLPVELYTLWADDTDGASLQELRHVWLVPHDDGRCFGRWQQSSYYAALVSLLTSLVPCITFICLSCSGHCLPSFLLVVAYP